MQFVYHHPYRQLTKLQEAHKRDEDIQTIKTDVYESNRNDP